MQEVIYCPSCRRRLNLPDDAIGRLAQCPACQRTFTAEIALANPPGAAAAGSSSRPAPAPVPRPSSAPVPVPSRRYDEELDRPRRRRRDEDDDFDRRRRAASHRGGEILTFGLLALLPCFVTSIIF